MSRDSTRINTRRATTVALTSFTTLALIPLLGHAKPNERVLLLLAAVPAAALFGYLAGYAASSAAVDAAQLQAAQLVRTAAVPASQVGATVTTLITEQVEGPTSRRGHLAAVPTSSVGSPVSRKRDGLSLVPSPASAAVSVPGVEDGDWRRLRSVDASESGHLTH